MLGLTSRRHTSTLPIRDVASNVSNAQIAVIARQRADWVKAPEAAIRLLARAWLPSVRLLSIGRRAAHAFPVLVRMLREARHLRNPQIAATLAADAVGYRQLAGAERGSPACQTSCAA